MIKKNILYVLGSYYPAQSGGPNNTIRWQAEALSKKGTSVVVATFKTDLNRRHIEKYTIRFNKKNRINGVDVYFFKNLFFKNLGIHMLFWIFFNIRKFDFVQLTSYFFPLTWFSAIVCVIYKIPFSIAPRGELEPGALKYKKKTKIFFSKIFLNKLYSQAKFILVTSKQELNFSRAFFEDCSKFEVIPNYYDLSNIIKLTDGQIREKSNVLYLGRLHPKKGIDNLILAYRGLGKKITNNNSLLIVGRGSVEYTIYLKDLINESQSNVILLGHKEGKEKIDLYTKSKVLVLPSHSENFGNVVLEALANSTPVIASKYTPWEEIEENQCGYWVDNSPESIQIYLEKIFTLSSDEYLNYCRNSHNLVCNNYNISQKINHLIDIYEKYSKKI